MEHIQRIGCLGAVLQKVDELKRKYGLLEAKKKDIENELEYEINRTCHKKPRKEVENWIANVRRAKPQIEELEQQVSTDGFLKRLFLEGKVDSLAREVDELTERKFERGLTLETYDNDGVALLTEMLIGEAFENNKRMILELLLRGKESVVGVYGMGGVGKTTLVTHIYNELLHSPNINVFWVTVSQNCSIQKLQHDMARKIGLDISVEDDVRLRAAKLSESLKRWENLILILDDVWDNVSLFDVGICVGENVRKLVLTTRSLRVCLMLNCENPIKVEPLSKGESWLLFGKTLKNDDLLSDHRINEIAKSLVRECDGLPLGISVMAGSMRGVKDVCEWSNALKEIREAKYRSGDMEFYERVFLVLKYSYDRLKDPDVQECLLYCSLFPEDSKIDRDVLIEYLIDEKLIDGGDGRRPTIEKGHTILNKLENVSLLEAHKNEHGKRSVKMHDLVRDMAIKISSDRPFRFWVHAGTGLQDFPLEEMWSENLSRISLTNNKITRIPSKVSPRCPMLTTLLLQDNRELCVLPDGIFVHMKKLNVLDLSRTGLTSLPTSISSLGSLTALLLQGCLMLECVPSLENLPALKRLDLSGSSIFDVPKGMEKLIYLKHLNLGECRNLKTVPEGMLPRLYRLQLFKSGFPLELRGGDVGPLERLETFRGNFSNFYELNTCLVSWKERRPKEYAISVGCVHYLLNLLTLNRRLLVLSRGCCNYEVNKILGLSRQVHIICRGETESSFALLPPDTQFLNLVGCNGITSLSHAAKSVALTACHVCNCFSMKHVVCSCCSDVPFFESLKRLELQCLPELTDIAEIGSTGNSDSHTFSSLKSLEINQCGRLKRLFAASMLPALRRLEALVVKECMELVEIVEDHNDDATETAFPNLKCVKLERLPGLRSFCGASSLKLRDSLESLDISKCPDLKRLTLLWDEPSPPSSLNEISVEREWWNSVEWKHPRTKALLQPFVTFNG